jgi:molybdenum cofactor biosynthesis protein B
MSESAHRSRAPQRIVVLVVTLSDTRDVATDASGATLRELLAAAGHDVLGPRILREDPAHLRHELEGAITQTACDAVVITGGTGVAPRDLAPEILESLYERTLPGFGEFFRALSFAEIGSAALLSRASAGIIAGKPVFSVPGSRSAVRLAAERLIVPELGHLVGELRRPGGGPS